MLWSLLVLGVFLWGWAIYGSLASNHRLDQKDFEYE